jgi:hypothetical protein
VCHLLTNCDTNQWTCHLFSSKLDISYPSWYFNYTLLRVRICSLADTLESNEVLRINSYARHHVFCLHVVELYQIILIRNLHASVVILDCWKETILTIEIPITFAISEVILKCTIMILVKSPYQGDMGTNNFLSMWIYHRDEIE